MKLIGLVSLFILISIKSFSFEYPRNHSLLASTEVKDSNALYLNFSNANFLWNNEFFSDIIEGYTLIGYHVTPQLQYHFSSNFKIDVGAHFLKYSGIDNFTTVIPTYSVTFLKNNYSVILGTLKGSIQHKMSDPLIFSERYFTKYIENGTQFLLNKDKLWLDVWLDWQTFIFPNDNQQEELVCGTNYIQQIFKNRHFKIEGIGSLLIGHTGGQIDTTNLNIKTLINYGLGVNISKDLSFKWLDRVSLESQYVGFSDNSPTLGSIYKNGSGFNNNLRFSKNKSFLQVGYWSADKFLSLMGNPIYQCESTVDESLNKDTRNLITANLFYSKSVFNGVYLGLMGDIYFDMESKETDYSMGLTIIIKQDFFLTRFEKRLK